MLIIIPYCNFSKNSFILLLLLIATGKMNGNIIMFIGKNVVATPPRNLSYEKLFFYYIIKYLLYASKFIYTFLYLLINIADNTDLSKILNIIMNITMNNFPNGIVNKKKSILPLNVLKI